MYKRQRLYRRCRRFLPHRPQTRLYRPCRRFLPRRPQTRLYRPCRRFLPHRPQTHLYRPCRRFLPRRPQTRLYLSLIHISSISAAKAQGGISTVSSVDVKRENILGVVSTYTTTVKGN